MSGKQIIYSQAGGPPGEQRRTCGCGTGSDGKMTEQRGGELKTDSKWKVESSKLEEKGNNKGGELKTDSKWKVESSKLEEKGNNKGGEIYGSFGNGIRSADHSIQTADRW